MRRRRLASLVLGALVVGSSGCSGCFDFDLGLDHLFECDPSCKGAVPGGTRACGLFGACTVTCGSGYASCNGRDADGCETVTHDNSANCGGCGIVCGATERCVVDVCVGPADAAPSALRLAENLATPEGLAADGQYVFYIDRGVLYRASREGGDTVALGKGLHPAGGVAVDGTYVYFAQVPSPAGDGGLDDGGDGGGGADGGVALGGMFRVRVVGGAIERVASADPLPGVEAMGGSVYFRDRQAGGGSKLLAIRGDAGGVSLADLGASRPLVRAFSVGGTAVAAIDDDAIVAIPFDGGAKQTLVPVSGSAVAVASSEADVVFYGGAADAGAFDLLRVGSDIGNHQLGTLAGLAFDPPYLFFANDGAGAIERIDTSSSGASAVLVASGQPGVSALAVDADYVYWITRAVPQELWRAPRGP